MAPPDPQNAFELYVLFAKVVSECGITDMRLIMQAHMLGFRKAEAVDAFEVAQAAVEAEEALALNTVKRGAKLPTEDEPAAAESEPADPDEGRVDTDDEHEVPAEEVEAAYSDTRAPDALDGMTQKQLRAVAKPFSLKGLNRMSVEALREGIRAGRAKADVASDA